MVQAKITYTLGDADLKEIVADYMKRTYGGSAGDYDVKIEIDPGSPYYNQLDAGRAASMKVVVDKKADAKPAATYHGPG